MLLTFIINSALVTCAVMIHYEFLQFLYVRLSSAYKIPHRFRIVVGVLGALVAHAVEIWLFAIAFYFLNLSGDFGLLQGSFDGSLLDCVYFSFTTFTTLGFGDIQPFGHLRFVTGIESLTGLVLITWTASFLYLEMHREWSKN